jgi:hypothetical protein
MKRLEKFFRKIGQSDVSIWGYTTLRVVPEENA